MACLQARFVLICLLSVCASLTYAETPDLSAYKDVLRNHVDCAARDHECFIKNAQRNYYFVKTYPTSYIAPQAAMAAAKGYEQGVFRPSPQKGIAQGLDGDMS
jgi:hypothetical protein